MSHALGFSPSPPVSVLGTDLPNSSRQLFHGLQDLKLPDTIIRLFLILPGSHLYDSSQDYTVNWRGNARVPIPKRWSSCFASPQDVLVKHRDINLFPFRSCQLGPLLRTGLLPFDEH